MKLLDRLFGRKQEVHESYWREQQRVTGLGNPQLGKADPNKPLPRYRTLDGSEMTASVCPYCGGYFFAICPCGGWARKDGEK